MFCGECQNLSTCTHRNCWGLGHPHNRISASDCVSVSVAKGYLLSHRSSSIVNVHATETTPRPSLYGIVIYVYISYKWDKCMLLFHTCIVWVELKVTPTALHLQKERWLHRTLLHTHTHFTVFSLQVGKINTAKQSADKGMSCASQISA